MSCISLFIIYFILNFEHFRTVWPLLFPMGAFRKKTKAASAEPLIDGGVAKSRAEQASENVEATTGEPIKDNDPTTPSSSPSSTIKTGSFSPSEASLNASIDSSVRREGVVMPGGDPTDLLRKRRGSFPTRTTSSTSVKVSPLKTNSLSDINDGNFAPGADSINEKRKRQQNSGSSLSSVPSTRVELLSTCHIKAASMKESSAVSNRTKRNPHEPQVLFGSIEVYPGDPLHFSDSEVYLAAVDHSFNPPRPVVLKMMNDVDHVINELEARRNLDDKFILPIFGLHVDSSLARRFGYVGPIAVHEHRGLTQSLRSCLIDQIKLVSGQSDKADVATCPSFPYVLCMEPFDRTLEDLLTHDFIDFNIVRKVANDIVAGIILLHSEQRIHGDLNPRCVVRVGSRWKISNLQLSKRIGHPTADFRVCNEGYMPPEVAALKLTSVEKYAPESSYDLFSFGCILFYLVFGSTMWNINKNGDISSEDMLALSQWSPTSFLKKASLDFSIDERTDNQQAAIDLIRILLSPTPEDRHSALRSGMVSVRQHEFFQQKPLVRSSLLSFQTVQATMLSSEREYSQYEEILKGLALEDQWELKRARKVLLFGILEPTGIHIPTSIVILKEKLPKSHEERRSKKEAKRRLKEAMKWASNFNVLDESVRGALEGDVTSVGHFWSLVSELFDDIDCMYLYFVDELTGEPVLGDDQSPDYPVEITARSDTLPSLLPLVHLTMRAMALYHGVGGIARMYGSTLSPLPEEWRDLAQGKVAELKSERGLTPFGSLVADIDSVKANREQFLNHKSSRARSSRALARFLVRKDGRKADFAGLRRYPDSNGFAIWTAVADAKGFHEAIQKRSMERMNEQRNHWENLQEREIDALVESISSGEKKLRDVNKALTETVKELSASTSNTHVLMRRITVLEQFLQERNAEVESIRAELDIERNKSK